MSGIVQRKRPKIGDVVEIDTPKGLAYAQYIYKHDRPPKFGDLLRVLPGLYPSRPSDFSDLVRQREQFLTFFPLGAACWRAIVQIVAHEEIPERTRTLPRFRIRGSLDPLPDGTWNWRLCDLESDREWFVGPLTAEQRDLPILPILEIITDVILVKRIVEGWTAAEDI